jgi:hypothetical protein
MEKIKSSVALILPPEQYSKIDWKNWQFNNKSLLNASFKNTLFFHQEAIAQIKQHDPITLKNLLTTYLEKGSRPTASPSLVRENDFENSAYESNYGNSWLDKYELDIKKISEILAISFSPEATAQERYNAFLQVKDFPIFLEKGAGFLISLIPQDKIENLVGYELSMSAKGVEAVSFKFGKVEQEDLYKSLLYIQSVINNRSFDLRLYTDQNGEFTAN